MLLSVLFVVMCDVNNMRRGARFAHPRHSAGRTSFVLILFRLPSTPALFILFFHTEIMSLVRQLIILSMRGILKSI